MVEFDRNLEREPGVADNLKICVVGVGGAGLNVLDRISLDRMLDATVVAMHTDVRVLTHSMSAAKIQLGADIMRGIGSGGDPELGREAAVASREKIRSMIEGHNMIFICCGLGGGTGSGAAPVVARLAKETGALVFVFATTPFVFEGRRRLVQAESSMAELQKHVDALILFENNRMGELVLPKEGIQKAFSQADQLIGHSVRAIATMVTQPGIVRMGLADLMAALNSPNARCLFGFGEARGANRVTDALKRSLKSPLVNQGQLLQNARNLLVHVAGGESLTLAEVETLMKQLGKCVPESTQIMFGLAVDQRMGDAISVTLVSSLSAQEMTAVGAEQGHDEQDEEDGAAEPARASLNESKSPVVVDENKQAVVESSAAKAVPSASQTVESATPAAATQQAAAVVQPTPPAQPATAEVQTSAPVQHAETKGQTEASEKTVTSDQPATAPLDFEHDLFGQHVVAPEAQNEGKAHVALNPQSNGNGAGAQAQVRIVVPKQQPSIAPESAIVPVAKTTQQQPPSAQAPMAESSVASQPPREVVQPVMPVKNDPVEPPVQTAPVTPKSIFSVIDTSDDDEEMDEDEGEVSNEFTADDDDDGSHWADKYIQSDEPQQPAIKSAEPKVREAAVAATATAAPAGGNGFKQGSFNLAEQEAGRFKGTTKTIVEGEDLDVPTWMRLKKKSGA